MPNLLYKMNCISTNYMQHRQILLKNPFKNTHLKLINVFRGFADEGVYSTDSQFVFC